ncbi:MAG: TRAP transporter small permease [Desulfovibrionaceae bacterium]|nr:TRAP transporter small permease [Desulfovibrionaceae bacterium]
MHDVSKHDESTQNDSSSQETPKTTTSQFIFEIFCATLFLGMIGLVFYNAVLRKVFNSSFPPSEEWARFLFIYITFFGAIEGFYHKRHIAVDMFVNMLGPAKRKLCEIIAIILGISAMLLLLYGGIVNVQQTMDTYSPATDVNMAFINGTLPIMAIAGLFFLLRDLRDTLRSKPTDKG